MPITVWSRNIYVVVYCHSPEAASSAHIHRADLACRCSAVVSSCDLELWHMTLTFEADLSRIMWIGKMSTCPVISFNSYCLDTHTHRLTQWTDSSTWTTEVVNASETRDSNILSTSQIFIDSVAQINIDFSERTSVNSLFVISTRIFTYFMFRQLAKFRI